MHVSRIAGRGAGNARWRATWLAVLALALAARPAGAGEPAPEPGMQEETEATKEDCRFLPDIRCGRSGRWDGFVKPIVTPFLFEDPFITTGVYPYFMFQEFPEGSIFRGGELYAAAVQARVALTDRLAFIATKDGFVRIEPDEGILADTKGFTDIALGLKYALLQMPEKNLIVSPSLRFDIPVGSSDTFSGNGDGVIIPAVSAAWSWEWLHLTGIFGGRIPFDGGKESSSIFESLQVNVPVTDWLSPFLVVTHMHWTGSGDGRRKVRLRGGAEVDLDTAIAVQGSNNFEGYDLVNLGTKGIDGADMVTMAWGASVRLTDHVWLAAAYERPISDRRDLMRQRMTSSIAFEF